jgi:hypothetical protein
MGRGGKRGGMGRDLPHCSPLQAPCLCHVLFFWRKGGHYNLDVQPTGLASSLSPATNRLRPPLNPQISFLPQHFLPGPLSSITPT